jgi:hypothetical protein
MGYGMLSGPRRRRELWVVAITAAVLGLCALATPACGTDPVGVESCQKIEKVRCESAQACGISLTRPEATGSSDKDRVAACTRYYDDECLHGLNLATDPGTKAVDTCVNAIINGDCSIVEHPETHAECSFLAPATDAGADADATGQ